ncbi:alpha/beta fold hydrolase [Microcella sp.]|uniref:alpha/beta fold hydrolase n=1 Tax=Microcella sp. TaxID=1913979 RepID=UPI00255E4D5D|nr:alpha/beta hydrolase [Microcella sp.]MBX9471565.1 alpha/beta hydrolase [Microcella sp.]
MSSVTAREHRIPTDVGELAVLELGHPDAPVLVLRHGIFLDRELWRPIGERYASTHRVVLIDAPGHGASGDPGREYSVQDDARASIQIMNALGIERATLIGHSWGGMSSLRVALDHPDRVVALGLVNTPLAPRTAAERRRYRTLVALLMAIGAPRWYGRQIVAALFDPAARGSEIALRMIEQVRTANRRVLARAMRAVLVNPDDVSDRLGELRIPLLAVAGRDDYVLDAAAAAMLAERVPQARIEHVPGDHVTPVEQPSALAALLDELVARR